jgi:NACHT domain
MYTACTVYTIDDIDRSCLRTLRCPDTLVVKNLLKENKDKLLHKSIEWILQDPQYVSWQDGDDVCLLWIKGGAGKGKTMMSIGLIERISLPQDDSTVVTYSFCQNADYELNTVEAIIKGLILQLTNQQKELKKSLRRRWDTVNGRFMEDVTSWRTLWNILLEMLDHCKCRRVYVIVDALDECEDEAVADLVKLIVRTGLNHPSKIKWLLTSRPLDSAEQELLAGSEQVRVSLKTCF